jgi:hypothetical protein
VFEIKMIPPYKPDPQKARDFKRRMRRAVKRRRKLIREAERQEREFWAKVPQVHKDAITEALNRLRDNDG